MTSHAIYPALDPVNPGTLSNKIITGLLRKKLGFEGLIITDDLEMGAITKGWGVAKGAVAAFEAGSDLLLICEDQEEVLAGMMALRDSLLRGDVPLERLHRSARRVMEAKARFIGERVEISIAQVKEYFKKDA